MGLSTFNWAMKFFGINPFALTTNGSKFIALARIFNSKTVTIAYSWAVQLYKAAKKLGYQITLDYPHNGYSWHIHIFGGNGKLSNLHIQITKAAWDYLNKLIN